VNETDMPKHAPNAGGEVSTLFDHFERLIPLSSEQRRSALSDLRATNPALTEELERLLLADSEAHALDQIAEGGGHKLAVALASLDAAEDQPPGVPGYRLLGVLGEGGMGRVYLAERNVQGYSQRVAIKLIRRDRATDIVRGRFLAEQRHLAALDHPGICRFIEAGLLDDGSPFVVMEFVEGRGLLEYCEAESLGLDQRVAVLRGLLDAVAHAHERLLIHRDLKASNVLVTPEGQAKLLDFGISKSLMEADLDATATSDRFFSLTATSPEQLLGLPLGVGCDVYALGLLTYRLLSGLPAYELAGLRPAEAQALILDRAPPAMSSVAPVVWATRLRGDLDSIVSRCLRKAPSERYANVREMDADLARWQLRLPISARRSDVGYRLRLFLRRNLARVAAAAVILAGAAVGAVGFWLQAQEVASQRAQAVEERDRAMLLSRILEDAFVQSDPARAGGEGVSVRAILDAVQSRLDEVGKSDPQLFASLASSIARVEVGLGADASAADLSQRALQAIAALDGKDELRRHLRMVGAEALSRTGHLDEAERLLDQARLDGDEPRWEWQYAKARLEMDRGRYTDAEARLNELLSNAAGADADQRLVARRLLVEALTLAEKVADAIVLQQQLYREALANQPVDHPAVLLEELELLRLQANLPETPAGTAARFEQVIAGLVGHYRADSAIVAGAYAASARAHFNEGSGDKAIAAMRQALDSFRVGLGEGHARTLRAQFNLAMALKGSRELREAVAILAELRQLSEKHFSVTAPIAVRAAGQQASMLADLGELREALTLLGELEPELEKLPADDARRLYLGQVKTQLQATACESPRPVSTELCPPSSQQAEPRAN
jgi:tRNA A-37 threonylcarbamoyl transferase component Bud32/tetratricopeptide (TPR) repeat protein